MVKVDLKVLMDIFENKLSKTVKNKKKLYFFERNKMVNLVLTYNKIMDPLYRIKHYNIFLIKEPKCRIVMSLDLDDKIINHFINYHILIPKLERFLDFRNIATRKKMGTDYGIRLVKKFLEKVKKYDDVYVLKLDIKKYFYSIDHDVLKSMLKKHLDDDEYFLMSNIIDSTNEDYINETIMKMRKDFPDLPIYEKGKGLPIGNLTSQFLSIFYLHELDHFIVHDLKVKYYVRYMDDFILIHPSKSHLKNCLAKIENKLENVYKLKLNRKKTCIVNVYEGFIFLGYKFFIRNKKTIMIIRNETLRKLKKRVRQLHYLYKKNYISFEQYFSSISNYMYSFKYGSKMKIKNVIDRYL